MINKRLERLTKNNSAIRSMFEEGKKLSTIYGEENVFDFSLGNPCAESPEIVKETIFECLNNNSSMALHGYMSNAGYTFVREAIADNLNKKADNHYTVNNIVMVVGAAGGLNCVLQALLNDNDEVIVIAPFFLEYTNYIENWGGKTIVANAEDETFQISIKNIEESISIRTKAVIVNNPNNPTGVVYTENNLRELSRLLEQKSNELGHPIYIISDEPYRELVYDGVKVPFIPNIYKNTIIVYSWSKSLSLPGERIGYIAISPTAQDSELLFNSVTVSNRILGFVNAPSLMQHVVSKCLECEPKLSLYDKNRFVLYKELTRIGYKCVYPQGAFYLWVKTPCSEDLFIEKAKQFKLLLVGGKAFCREGYVRIAYCVSEKKVNNSIKAFQDLWSCLKKLCDLIII